MTLIESTFSKVFTYEFAEMMIDLCQENLDEHAFWQCCKLDDIFTSGHFALSNV